MQPKTGIKLKLTSILAPVVSFLCQDVLIEENLPWGCCGCSAEGCWIPLQMGEWGMLRQVPQAMCTVCIYFLCRNYHVSASGVSLFCQDVLTKENFSWGCRLQRWGLLNNTSAVDVATCPHAMCTVCINLLCQRQWQWCQKLADKNVYCLKFVKVSESC